MAQRPKRLALAFVLGGDFPSRPWRARVFRIPVPFLDASAPSQQPRAPMECENPRGDRPLVIVGHKFTSYRQAIAGALRVLRPRIEVVEVGPQELDREVERLSPRMVICSPATRGVTKATVGTRSTKRRA